MNLLEMNLLEIYHGVCQRKNCENRLLFGEVMGKSLVSCFLLTHGVCMLITVAVIFTYLLSHSA